VKDRRSIIVSGDRNWGTTEQREVVLQALDKLKTAWLPWMPIRLAHGAARGVDTIADEMGKLLGYQVIPYPADWDRYGKWAGPERNGRMLDKERPVALVLAFHDNLGWSKGTKNMVEQALADGVPCVVFGSKSVTPLTRLRPGDRIKRD
jgi:hypothetical protein